MFVVGVMMDMMIIKNLFISVVMIILVLFEVECLLILFEF